MGTVSDRQPEFSVEDARAVRFALDLLPHLPGLLIEDPATLIRTLQQLTGSDQGHLAEAVGAAVAPWPLLRRMWEDALPGQRGRNYQLDRDDGIRYAARVVLESPDQLLGDDALEFCLELRDALIRTHDMFHGAELVRDLMRRHPKPRDLLERIYPPAANPRSFEGGTGMYL